MAPFKDRDGRMARGMRRLCDAIRAAVRRRGQTEAERGRQNALKFLESGPSAAAIKKYQSAAKVDRDMGRNRDYAEAVLRVLDQRSAR